MMRRRGKEKPKASGKDKPSISTSNEPDESLNAMALKVEQVAASSKRTSFYQVRNSVYTFGDEPLLTPTVAATPETFKELRQSPRRLSSARISSRQQSLASPKQHRRASIRPLQDFRLHYHAQVVAKESFYMLRFLVHGTPRWIAKLARMICFIAAMMPAFCVFCTFYVVTSDRIALPYKTQNRTSRHYLDIYGSTNGQNKHNSINNSEASNNEPKPVILFLTGGAWIIGYKMWGALLARALVPFGIMVVIPDYRNFPQATIDGIIDDADCAVDWTLEHIHEYGGDPSRIVIAGQSAGAHIGACLLLRKSQMEAPTEVQTVVSTTTSWHSVDINGFIAVSGPYDLVAMKEILHQNGLDKSIVSAMFCHDVVQYSPTVMVRGLSNGNSVAQKRVQRHFPPTCVIHGEIDKTVPYKQSLEFFEALKQLGVEQPLEFKLYPSWSHTDPILEAPFAGNHLFHKDVYELVKLWTDENETDNDEAKVSTISGESSLLPFDENHPACQKICPVFLVEIGRFCNPF